MELFKDCLCSPSWEWAPGSLPSWEGWKVSVEAKWRPVTLLPVQVVSPKAIIPDSYWLRDNLYLHPALARALQNT